MTTEQLLAGSLAIVALSGLGIYLLSRPTSWLSRAIDRAVTDTSEVLQ